ncbi:glycosyltransferase family 2 protein [Chloroflexota bacterium]
MRNPLVSIVTPSFNGESFIEDVILSIKHQTYQNIEHIIVDGGSTDRTRDIICRHEGTYRMRWLSEADDGMYEAINKGMRLAGGDILAYLNCDDLYLPWSVQTAVSYLQEYPIIFGDWLNLDCDQGSANLEFAVPFVSSYYRCAGIIAQPTVFWRREVVRRIGEFDQRFGGLGDVDYWLRAASVGYCPRRVDEVLAIVRNHASNLSAKNKDSFRRELESIRQAYSHPVARALWAHIPVMPIYRRIQFIRYTLGLSSVCPLLRAAKAIPADWKSLLNALWPSSRRLALYVDWARLLPLGVTLEPSAPATSSRLHDG